MGLGLQGAKTTLQPDTKDETRTNPGKGALGGRLGWRLWPAESSVAPAILWGIVHFRSTFFVTFP